MNEKMHTALIELQDHLTEIKQWSDLIKRTEGVATDSIEKSAAAIAKASLLIIQIQSDYETAVSTLQNTTSNMMTTVEDVISEYKQLTEASKELVDYLRSVNFPSRLDKIDSSVAVINQGVTSLTDKLERYRDQLTSKFEKEHENTRQMIQGLQNQAIQLKKRQIWFFVVLIFVLLSNLVFLLYNTFFKS